MFKATAAMDSDGDYDTGFAGRCRRFVDLFPGHAHLRAFYQAASAAMRKTGSVPFAFKHVQVD